MSLLKLLGMVWTAWKVAAKRFGPAGGLVVATAVVAGYVYLKPWITEHYPALGRIVE
jgi:hypothetical protein